MFRRDYPGERQVGTGRDRGSCTVECMANEITISDLTKVYGASDDLIEFEGGFHGEVGAYGTDDAKRGVLVVLSDGTLLEVKYGKGERGIWGIGVLAKGALFDRLDLCDNEDHDPHSDVAHFKPGIKWAYAAKEWESVQ